MRTTLTLDDDVAAQIEQLRRDRREPYKAIVNELLRRGLEAANGPQEPSHSYRIKPHDPGRCRLPDVDSLHDALVFGEGDAYR